MWGGSFRAFIERVAPYYRFSPHLDMMIEYLEAVEAGYVTRLMIFMPPRHGKSETCSKLFPAWYLGRNPNNEIIATSYSSSLAQGFGVDVRGFVAADDYPYPDVKPKGRSVANANWKIEGWQGGYRAAGVDAGIVGRGANVLMIDDPHKDQAEADSPTMREKTYTWFKGTARTRLENEFKTAGKDRRKGAIVLINTRWHEDDLAGRLIKEARADPKADQWEILDLPAMARSSTRDPLGRVEGAALWPDKFDEADLESIRVNTPPRIWAAQYQQKPTGKQGTIFLSPWFSKRYDPTRRTTYEEIVVVVDSASKTGVHNDYTSIAVWGRVRGGYWYDVLDHWRDRVRFGELQTKATDMYHKWHALGARALVVEDASSGIQLIQNLEDEGEVVVEPWRKPSGVSKENAAEGITPYFIAGRVRLPRGAEWVNDWIKAHTSFPFAEYDDDVDTTTTALNVIGRPIETEEQRRDREEAAANFGHGRGMQGGQG